MKNWKRRYFRLYGRNLAYFVGPTEEIAKGEVQLTATSSVGMFLYRFDLFSLFFLIYSC